MKKMMIALTLLFVVSIWGSVHALVPSNTMSDGAVRAYSSKNEIQSIAKKLNIKHVNKVVQIIISEKGKQDNPILNNKPSLFLAEYILKNRKSSHKLGELIRASIYAEGTGTMYVEGGGSSQFEMHYNKGVSSPRLRECLHFNLQKVGMVDTQTFKIPRGKSYTVQAFTYLQVKKFDIYEDDIWYDDYLGKSSAVRPVGIVYVVYR